VTVLVAASLTEAMVGIVAYVLGGSSRHSLLMTCSLFPVRHLALSVTRSVAQHGQTVRIVLVYFSPAGPRIA
jgi:hypothetical protein